MTEIFGEDGSMLSVRVITTEHSLEKPIPSLDVTKSVRGSAVRRLPVIHLFGATKNGNRDRTV